MSSFLYIRCIKIKKIKFNCQSHLTIENILIFTWIFLIFLGKLTECFLDELNFKGFLFVSDAFIRIFDCSGYKCLRYCNSARCRRQLPLWSKQCWRKEEGVLYTPLLPQLYISGQNISSILKWSLHGFIAFEHGQKHFWQSPWLV